MPLRVAMRSATAAALPSWPYRSYARAWRVARRGVGSNCGRLRCCSAGSITRTAPKIAGGRAPDRRRGVPGRMAASTAGGLIGSAPGRRVETNRGALGGLRTGTGIASVATLSPKSRCLGCVAELVCRNRVDPASEEENRLTVGQGCVIGF